MVRREWHGTIDGDIVRYAPVNRCIYCGATDAKLTDEHTWPDGLMGRHILPQASCQRCANLINKEFEQHCLQKMLGLARARHGIRSSKKRPAQPLRLTVEKHSGAVETIHAEPNAAPMLLFMPLFPYPSILRREPPPKVFDVDLWAWQSADTDELLRRYGARAFKSPRLDVSKVARFVAKIAHAHGTAMLGDLFIPRLPDIILGKTNGWPEYVGSVWEERSPGYPQHQLGLTRITRRDGKHFAGALIRFFADLGSPLYCVVLGELRGPWPWPEEDSFDPKAISKHI